MPDDNFFDQVKPAPAASEPWGEEPPMAESEADYGEKVVLFPGKKKAAEPRMESNGEIVPPEFADDALALRFSGIFADKLRYVSAWGAWMTWDGTIWRKDDTLKTYDLVRHVCRAASGEAAKPSLQTQLASGKTVASVEKLARADRRHAATAQQWDADGWLLNTPRGIVDLTTGGLIPHDPDQHMTKTAAVTPEGDCPTWLKFLGDVTQNNNDLIGYLQRVAGYALTGSIKEQALFFAYGTGGNGKGTFLNTIQAIMGDYAIVSSAETFTAQSGSRHLTELARLQGARLVVAQETEEGKQLAESRVKAITGGDPITANFMRQDHFTFIPQFKLFISGNHKPALRNVDAAIRRRFNMIPFEVEITAEHRDQDLPDKLKAEWPGILRWMVDGCLWWQGIRLSPPEAVRVATDEYFEAEDAFGMWMADCCQFSKFASASSSELFHSWEKWAKAAGEVPGSQKRFSQTMATRGHPSKMGGNGKMAVSGVGLRIPPPFSESPDDRL